MVAARDCKAGRDTRKLQHDSSGLPTSSDPIEPRSYIITAYPIVVQGIFCARNRAVLAVCHGVSSRNYGASDLLLRHSLCPCSPESTRCRSFDQVPLVHAWFVARLAAFSKLGWKSPMTTGQVQNQENVRHTNQMSQTPRVSLSRVFYIAARKDEPVSRRYTRRGTTVAKR